MKRIIKIIPILILLISCTPQQRLNKLLNRHPYLAKKDTIHFIDTVQFTTERIQVDTITSIESMRRDTFVMTRENLTVKTIIHKDSVFIWGECDADTIYKVIERQIPYDKFEYQEVMKWKKIIGWLAVALLVITILYILFRIFRKFLPF